MNTKEYIAQVDTVSSHNYHPLPVVIERAKGVWVYDVEGKKYLDMLSAYSAMSHGHLHPKIIKTLIDQAGKVTLTSRAFHCATMGPCLERLCKITGFERTLPMNTGVEAVETAIKVARKWSLLKKKVPENKAEIIVCENNFHGRTTTAISFSTENQYKYGFGPLTPGFKTIPFGDAKALEAAITPNTAAFLVEPIQGEGGILMPPDGFLTKIREITKKNNVLLLLDEIQTGLGRTGKLFAHQYENCMPDILILGKALGGGIYPVSAIMANNDVMDVLTPGDHGSTFGGNPLAMAIADTALQVLIDEDLTGNAYSLGAFLMQQLKKINSPIIKEVRGRGLMIGVEIKTEYGKARPYCERLFEQGVLCKETHHQVIRFAPPLTITKEEINWAMERIVNILK